MKRQNIFESVIFLNELFEKKKKNTEILSKEEIETIYNNIESLAKDIFKDANKRFKSICEFNGYTNPRDKNHYGASLSFTLRKYYNIDNDKEMEKETNKLWKLYTDFISSYLYHFLDKNEFQYNTTNGNHCIEAENSSKYPNIEISVRFLYDPVSISIIVSPKYGIIKK